MEAYYDRRMSNQLVELLMNKYEWVIDYVKSHGELDFQTGSNKNKSWFSIYRGTGRIAMLTSNGKWKIAEKRDKNDRNSKTRYIDYAMTSPACLETLLKKIKEDEDFDKFYIGKDGKKREGYYQTLIARRYSLNCRHDDDLLVIDKEFVIGGPKDTSEWVNRIIEMAQTNPKFPKHISSPGRECDFLGINKNGDLVLMELKRHEDVQKVYLSPLQIGNYDEMARDFLNHNMENMNEVVFDMIEQKKRLGILLPQWEKMPERLSGNIKLAVVVGGEISGEVWRRFNDMKDIVGKDIAYYTCDETDGTLIEKP